MLCLQRGLPPELHCDVDDSSRSAVQLARLRCAAADAAGVAGSDREVTKQ